MSLGRRFGRVVVKQIGSPPPISIRTLDVPTNYRAGKAYAALALAADGPSSGIEWTVTAGDLPPGWTVLPTGIIPSGVFPDDAQGSYAFTVEASAAGYGSDSALITVDIDYAEITITIGSIPSVIPDGTTAYAGIAGGIRVSGGSGSFGSMTKTAGYFAPGLGLSGSGTLWDLSGTGTSDGAGQTYTATVSITDTITGETGTAEIVTPVQPLASAAPLQFSYPAISPRTEGAAFAAVNAVVSNVIGTASFAKFGGALQGDIAINPTTGQIYVPDGTLTGAVPGTNAQFGVKLTDDGTTPPRVAVASVTIPIAATPTPTIGLTIGSFPGTINVGDTFNVVCTATGFAGTAQWTLSGSLPQGGSYTISGTGSGTFTFVFANISASAAGLPFSGSLEVKDSADATNKITKAWSFTVEPLAAAFVPPSQTAPLPTLTLHGGSAETVEYDVADFVDAGSATDLVVGIEVDPAAAYPLPAGVSLAMNGTGIDGKFRAINAGTLNPGSNIVLPDQYRLSLNYDDQPGGGQLTDEDADWLARSTGPGTAGMRAVDFNDYATTDAMLADKDVGYNQYSTVSGNPIPGINVSLNANGIRGKCLRVSTDETATSQGGGWGKTYRFDGAAVNGFYIQFAYRPNEAAAAWPNPGDPKKIFQLESYGTGQVSVLADYHGFPTIMVNGSEGLKRIISTGTGYGGDEFRHTAIDNGTTLVNGDSASYARRYGLSKKRTTDLYAMGSLVNQQGYVWPDDASIAGGSVPFVIDGWIVCELFVYNDLANDANDVVKLWVAKRGEAPRLQVTLKPTGAGTFPYTRLGVPGTTYFRRWEALNYPTRRTAEPGRPTQTQDYDQIIPSLNWIPFPGHLSGLEPT